MRDMLTPEQGAARLRSALAQTGLTQREAGARLGVPQSRVSEWMTGRRVPTWTRLLAIATALDLDPSVLFPELLPRR